jgi:hypothetical protein
VPRPTQGSLRALRLRGCHPLWHTVPGASASSARTTGLLRVRSPLLPESRLMSSPPGTEMFQFPGFAARAYGFGPGYPQRGGLPHSDMRGSTLARNSPRLIAACHVLHRLLAPRHPPDALLSRSRPVPPPPPIRSADPGPHDTHTLTHSTTCSIAPWVTPPMDAISTRSSFTMPKSAPTARPRRARTRVAAERQAQEARAQRRRHRPPASPGHTGGAAARPRRSRRSSGSHPARPAAPGRCRQGRGRQAKADRRRPTDRRRMEAIGFEPTTPCLQSRRSPAELRPRRRQPQAGGTSLSAHHPAAPRLSRLSRRPCRDWLPRCRRAATSFVSPSGGFRPRQRRGRNGPGRT